MKRVLALILFACLFAACLWAQELDPSHLLKSPTNDWPTYNGDYTGRRFSPLTQINRENVGSLTLALWHRFENVVASRVLRSTDP